MTDTRDDDAGPGLKATATTQLMNATAPCAIVDAAEILRSGGLVAFPTETVYGLGADATNHDAIARLYAVKGRPAHNPLIAHVAEPKAAFALGIFDERARKLADAFWPGPLTLVVPSQPDCMIVAEARAGLDTVALRCPSHDTARRLLDTVGRPVAAPSANRSGYVSPTRAEHVLDDLNGTIDMVLDGGQVRIGLESTVVACLGDGVRVLRPGFILPKAIDAILGKILPASADATDTTHPLAPGQLDSHYAPHKPLRLNVSDVSGDEALLTFGQGHDDLTANALLTLPLSSTGNLVEAASRLFDALRRADQSEARSISVTPIPDHGLGLAMNERLRRAAAEH
ncbi:MAG: L-threonylcarbamoyladenylate synthase [Pseudomonadota bacterium]